MATKKILIVDDSATERAFLKMVLGKAGFECLQASCGEEGIAMAKLEQPDLIMMDVVMPGVNGFQATRLLTHDESTRHIPVFISTTRSQDTDMVWGMRQGAAHYFVKPLRPEELIARIRDTVQ